MEQYSVTEEVKDPAAARELQRLAQVLMGVHTLPILHAEPTKPIDGQVAICDGTDWDPLTLGNKQPVWYDLDATAWKAF